MSLLTCPFCTETNFDLVGLKYHLRFSCDAFDYTPNPGQHPGVRRLRLLHDVRSELPFAPFSVAKARVYDPAEIDVNPHGAVSVMTPGGWLGIKPDEMEWIDDPKTLTGQSL